MKEDTIREIKSYLRVIGYSLLFIYFVTNYVCTVYRIEGNSMNPLLESGQRVLSNCLAYKIKPVSRGDVVVFTAPSEPQKSFIKRIIGLPGEVIEIKEGIIFVDGHELEESFVPEEYRTGETMKRLKIPMGHFFVAGDHRTSSNDSRQWSTTSSSATFVPRRYIHGEIVMKLWPLTEFGGLPSFSTDDLSPAI